MDKNKSNSSDEIRKSVGSIYSALLDKRHKDHEEKVERRKAEAEEHKAEEDAKSFYANGASIDLIAKSLHMTENQVRELVKETVPVKVE